MGRNPKFAKRNSQNKNVDGWDLSWICFTLSEFRLSSFATVGSICSLTGLVSLRSLRPSANPLNPLFYVSRQFHHTIKKAITFVMAFFNCRWGDLNPHGSLHMHLKHARLPFRHIDLYKIFSCQTVFIPGRCAGS